MSSVDLTVWFVCKSCKLYFAKVNGFIDHKKESHFTEFQIQNTGCIVFEERIDGNFNRESGSVERKPILLKEESQLTNDSQIETDDDPDPSVIGCFDDPNLPWKIADFPPQTKDVSCTYSELTTVFLVPKTELVTYESDTEEADTSLVDPLVQPQYKYNPNVLAKRLTSTEIEAASLSSSSADNLELKLNKHLKTQSVSASFKCHHLNCGKVLKSIRGFRNHLKVTHSNSRPFRCPNPNCDLTFKKSSDLKAHMIRHSNYRPFGCPQCGKTFKLRYDLVEHVRSHTGERPYKCPVENCGKSFAKSTTFCRHKRSMHHIK